MNEVVLGPCVQLCTPASTLCPCTKLFLPQRPRAPWDRDQF